MSDRRPRKPVRNPGHIVFPKVGAAYAETEQMPRNQAGLEAIVGVKFLGALRHFLGRDLRDLRRGTEPADLECDEGDAVVGIQVVEVIDHDWRQLLEMRSGYLAALRQRGEELFGSFRGCRLVLVDDGEPPYLPQVTSSAGSECLGELVEQIRNAGTNIASLEVKKIRSVKLTTTAPARRIQFILERMQPYGSEAPVTLDWHGGGRSYQVDLPRGLLPAAVRSKIEKQYAKPSYRFVLLAYSTETLFDDDDPDFAATRDLLDGSPHPFDEVWFLYLYVNQDLGHIVKVWPMIDDRSGGAA
jgi:hypothetical protein